MSEQPDFLNVRNLAMVLTAAPLALLLLFGAIDVSWSRLSQNSTKSNIASDTTPKLQPAKTRDQ